MHPCKNCEGFDQGDIRRGGGEVDSKKLRQAAHKTKAGEKKDKQPAILIRNVLPQNKDD